MIGGCTAVRIISRVCTLRAGLATTLHRGQAQVVASSTPRGDTLEANVLEVVLESRARERWISNILDQARLEKMG